MFVSPKKLSESRLTSPGPLLLGYLYNDSDIKQETGNDRWKSLPKHRDEDQVRLDVDRSFIYYPNGKSSALQRSITRS